MKQDSLALTDQVTPMDPSALLKLAIEHEGSIEVIERMAALMERQRDFQARVDFDNALNDCQRQIDRIIPNKDRENGIKWADYAQIDRTVRPVYLNASLSIGFSEVESADKNRLRMKATVSRCGASRDYFVETSRIPPNSKMSQADADASAASRAKRYLMLDIFNIAVGIDHDEKKPFDGGKQAGSLDEKQHIALRDNIANAGTRAELQRLYLAALAEAEKIGDAHSIRVFIAAKNERMKEIQ